LFHEPSIVLAEAERRYPKGAKRLDPRLGRQKILGDSIPDEVAPEPLFDPAGERLRG